MNTLLAECDCRSQTANTAAHHNEFLASAAHAENS
jgi:hypothetical protein